MDKGYVTALADMFYPKRSVGCERRSSDVLCCVCFEGLPRMGSPVCGRCGLPTAFATFLCEECKNVDFGFESARTPLRYEGVGEEIVRALKYQGYKKVVGKLAAPLVLQVLGAMAASTPWCRCTGRVSGRGGSTGPNCWRGA